MRPPIRLAALTGLQVIYVFTHDSLFLGEDGPTHQPVEQLPALRAVPNLVVVRPADGPETAAAWTLALQRRDGPTALVLSRQELPVLSRPAGFDMTSILSGGYVLSETAGAAAGDAGAKGAAPVVLIASGSEVSSALEAQTLLAGRGVASRVVSMPCLQIFRGRPDAYRRAVVPADGLKVVVEAAVLQGWEAIAGPDALLLGVDRFGASAPWKILQDKYGLSGARVADAVLRHLGRA
jgi:transketolase